MIFQRWKKNHIHKRFWFIFSKLPQIIAHYIAASDYTHQEFMCILSLHAYWTNLRWCKCFCFFFVLKKNLKRKLWRKLNSHCNFSEINIKMCNLYWKLKRVRWAWLLILFGAHNLNGACAERDSNILFEVKIYLFYGKWVIMLKMIYILLKRFDFYITNNSLKC